MKFTSSSTEYPSYQWRDSINLINTNCYIFVALFVALIVVHFAWNFVVFHYEVLSPKYSTACYMLKHISSTQNKEFLSHLRVYRKSAATAHMDGRRVTDGPLYTGFLYKKQRFDFNTQITTGLEKAQLKSRKQSEFTLNYYSFSSFFS